MKYLILLTAIFFINLIPEIVSAREVCAPEFKFNYEKSSCEKIILPENAVLNSEKNDWNCRIGYKKNAAQNTCRKVEIPLHGRLNYSGDDVECNRGYMKTGDECRPLILPENGILDVSGQDWHCIATYRRVGDNCIKTTLPDNAEFFNQGFDWFCKNQFRKEGDKCSKFEIPPNAHLTFLANDWQCNKGYLKNSDRNSCDPVFIPMYAEPNSLGTFTCDPGYDKQGGECRKVPEIENGRFFEHGPQFYCLSGYVRNEELRTCQKVKVPENAKFDSSSINGWSCLGGYVERGVLCEKFETEHIVWSGNTWYCEPGYIKDYGSQICQKVSLPENAQLENNSDGWSCKTGFTKNYRENRCDKNSI